MKLSFELIKDHEISLGEVLYISSDQAIEYNYHEAQSSHSFCSLVFQTLELYLDLSTGELLHYGGYFPKSDWMVTDVSKPVSKKYRLRISNLILQSGIAIDYPTNNWAKKFDPDLSLLEFCSSQITESCCLDIFEFSENCFIAFNPSNVVVGLWMKLSS